MKFHWGFLVLGLVLASCGRDRVVSSSCREDNGCQVGFLCENYQCVPAVAKQCDSVVDGNPILQPAPHVLAFGHLDIDSATKEVVIHNLGNCTLTLYEATLKVGAASPFHCPACEDQFPMEVFPGRTKAISIEFKAERVGPFDDALVILSDDKEFPELQVPLHADFMGVPELRVAPNPVEFGYVAEGRVLKRQVQVTNRGTGIAPLHIESATLVPGDSADFELVVPALPAALPPVSAQASAIFAVEVQYHPRTSAAHAAELVLITSKGEFKLPLRGNSLVPPRLNVSTEVVDLGKVPLGQTHSLPLSLVNEGGAPLNVKFQWGGAKPSTDLFALPQQLTPIEPGKYLEMQIGVTAATVGPVSGLLVLTSNDPSKPVVSLSVMAEGVIGPGPEVVKVEMSFENGSDSVFDSDLRNVDLTLEHPYGYVCNKATPKPSNWGNYGNPSWLAFAPKEEPERVILPDVIQDGIYRVMLHYMEDCASLPTDLMAGLLGISIDALVEYLSGGAVKIDGKDVGELISKVCLSRSRSNVSVRAYVNGTLIMEKTVPMLQRGDATYAFELVRTAGKFSAR